MSLSEQNRATLRRAKSKVFHWLRAPSEHEAETELNRLLDAARAEGVAALQQAGEPVGYRWRWRSDLYCEGALPGRWHYDNRLPVLALGEDWKREVEPLFTLPQQTALVEQGVEKIIAQHEPAACGASAPSEPPWDGGWQDIASAPRDGTTI